MARVKLDKKLFTANFKRDYVAYSAVAIFALIVLSEVVLAVSIPVYFVRSDLWDLQIARQQLMTDFDALRGFCHKLSPKNPDAVEENNILLWDACAHRRQSQRLHAPPLLRPSDGTRV